MVSDMDLGKSLYSSLNLVCKGCIKDKYHRASYLRDETRRATKSLKIVHLDVCVSMKTTSFGGKRYFLTFIDDFLMKVWIYILKSKNKCLETLKEFKALAEIQSEYQNKVF